MMADELFVACTLQTTPMAQEISSFSSSRSLPLKTQRFFGESVKQRELRIFIRIWNLQVLDWNHTWFLYSVISVV